MIFENGEVINWPFSEITQDDSQNTSIVFLNRSTHEKIELINGEENLPKHLLKRTSFRFNSKHLMAFLGGIIFQMIFFSGKVFLTLLDMRRVKFLLNMKKH